MTVPVILFVVAIVLVIADLLEVSWTRRLPLTSIAVLLICIGLLWGTFA